MLNKCQSYNPEKMSYYSITNKAFNTRNNKFSSLYEKVQRSALDMIIHGNYGEPPNPFNDDYGSTRKLLQSKVIGDSFKKKFNYLYPRQNDKKVETKEIVADTMNRIKVSNSLKQIKFYNPKPQMEIKTTPQGAIYYNYPNYQIKVNLILEIQFHLFRVSSNSAKCHLRRRRHFRGIPKGAPL